MFSHIGLAAYKKDLTNTIELCSRLDNPHKKLKSIHVAGTNGKGSVSHMLSAIFQSAGYKTGLYTSPHLYDFRERIRVNGVMVDENFVVDFVKRMQPAIEEIKPSFFEITVVMAFDFFARQKVDVAIIEVGMGGRLDSTNVITPEISVITSIGWDHMNVLGNTLEAIAYEKAGIIKQNTPVVIGEYRKETSSVFTQVANKESAPIFFATESFGVEDCILKEKSIEVAVLDKKLDVVTLYESDLAGMYQAKNIVTVIQVLALLRTWNISDAHIVNGFHHVKELTGLHGRWEVIHQQPTVVLEVAHNKDGIEQMLIHLKNLHYNKLHIIIGMVKDKDVDQVLSLLPATALYYFSQSHIPRALDASVLQQKAASYKLEGVVWMNVNDALNAALNHASENDLIIVCGSIFLVAEVKRELIRHHA